MLNTSTNEERIVKRLNVLIALNLINLSKKNLKMDLRDQINFLSNFGIKNNEIAEILGKSINHINKELHLIRRSAVNK